MFEAQMKITVQQTVHCCLLHRMLVPYDDVNQKSRIEHFKTTAIVVVSQFYQFGFFVDSYVVYLTTTLACLRL